MKEINENDQKAIYDLLKNETYVPKSLHIVCLDSTESTNKDAKDAAQSLESDAVFIAKRQTAGRGRLGRSFSSEDGGLYMSFLFKRQMKPEDALKITVFAAVCVARAISITCGVQVGIKWVNDLFVAEKKLSGILCEGACDEFGRVTHAVLGIGVNVSNVLEGELFDIATSLFAHTDAVPPKTTLAAAIVKEIYAAADSDFSAVLDEYRRRSCIIGKKVRVVKHTEEYFANVIGIDELGALLIEREGGEREALSSGEISVRF